MSNWIICKNCKKIVPHLEKCDICDNYLPNYIVYYSDNGHKKMEQEEPDNDKI